MPTRSFSDTFCFGASTAAYQIEGSPLADGASMSIWHRFSHTPGRVARAETGDVACDHYRRYPEDIKIMQSLGIRHYRLSFSWSRLLPQGQGAVNPQGFAHYDRLIDMLLAHDIMPMVTLYHWDLPAALDDRGGWVNPESEHWFAEYAQVCFKHFDDRVARWVTINEPWVIADGGYMHGVLAPGHKSAYEAILVGHHLMRAHGRALERYRALGRHQIGIALNLEPKVPASNSEKDIYAARVADAYMNRQYLDPLFKGQAPSELAEVFKDAWVERNPEEYKLICAPIDFLGVNYYTRGVTTYDPSGWPVPARSVIQPDSAYTDTGWEICPSAFSDLLLRIKHEYANPLVYITENGTALRDPPVNAAGRIADNHRIAYLSSHLHAVLDAIEQGARVEGYYVWSLLDNLEWALGYSKRFGIVRVDPQDQNRTIKDSGYFYQQLIQSRQLTQSPQ
jgi:beta-glucosidase